MCKQLNYYRKINQSRTTCQKFTFYANQFFFWQIARTLIFQTIFTTERTSRSHYTINGYSKHEHTIWLFRIIATIPFIIDNQSFFYCYRRNFFLAAEGSQAPVPKLKIPCEWEHFDRIFFATASSRNMWIHFNCKTMNAHTPNELKWNIIEPISCVDNLLRSIVMRTRFSYFNANLKTTTTTKCEQWNRERARESESKVEHRKEKKVVDDAKMLYEQDTKYINLIKKNEHELHIKCDDLMLGISHFRSFVRDTRPPFKVVAAFFFLRTLCLVGKIHATVWPTSIWILIMRRIMTSNTFNKATWTQT